MKEIKCPYCGNVLTVKADEYHAEKTEYFVCETCQSMIHTSGEKDGHVHLEME